MFELDEDDLRELAAEADWARRQHRAFCAHPDPRDPDYPFDDEEDEDDEDGEGY